MPVSIKPIKITTELYNPYPTYTEVYKNKLDERDPSIFFTISGEPFDVDLNVFDVTISITIDDIIITDNNTEIAAQALDSGKKGIVVELSALDVELFAGLMKIELTLTNSAGDNVPVSPIMINITPSILDNASAIPESVGSVSDMLQLYPDLKSFVDNGVSSSQIADGAVATGKLAAGAVTTEKIADAAITEAKISNTSISTAKLKDGAVTIDKLNSGLASDLSDVNTALNGASGLMSYKNLETISEASALDGINRIGNRVWEFVATGSLASAIGITNPSHCSMTAVFCDGTWYQIITVLPSLAQYVRKVNTVYPNWSADSWASSSLLTRISALENTVGTLNTQLENALNGGA